MSLRRQIAARLLEICLESGSFGRPPDRPEIEAIGDLDLLESGFFDSMSLMFLQVEVENEWGVNIPETQFAAWLRTINQIADYVADRLPAPGRSPESGAAEAPSLSRDGRP